MQNQTNPLLKTVLIPEWIHRGLLQNNASMTELCRYSKVRQIISIEALAEWYYINDRLKLDGNTLSSCDLSSLFSDISPAERQEITHSVVPLSGSEATASSVTTRLSHRGAYNTMDRDYDFAVVNNTIFVIINEGFLSTSEDPKKFLDFLRQYLKTCYSMTSINDVSTMAAYNTYLKHLAKQASIN